MDVHNIKALVSNQADESNNRLQSPYHFAHREWHDFGISLLEGIDALLKILWQGDGEVVLAPVQPTGQREHMPRLSAWLWFIVEEQDLQILSPLDGYLRCGDKPVTDRSVVNTPASAQLAPLGPRRRQPANQIQQS